MSLTHWKIRKSWKQFLAAGLALSLGACGTSSSWWSGSASGSVPKPREQVWALTDSHQLLRFAAAEPQRIQVRRSITGLPSGERLVGIDYRVARGTLYALSRSGLLYTIDTETGAATRVGNGPGLALDGSRVAIDFNPVADRLRVVSDSGLNLRIHPDTGALVDFDPQQPGVQPDPRLAYVAGDVAKKAPRVTAAGYTYNKGNDKLTTNYAIDVVAGTLVMQGSHEDSRPAVSPNTGRLSTVGALGVGSVFEADLDISDLDNTPLAALRTDKTRLYLVDLKTGGARLIGPIGDGSGVRSIAIEP